MPSPTDSTTKPAQGLDPATICSDGRCIEWTRNWHAEYSSWNSQQVLRPLQRGRLTPKGMAKVGRGACQILQRLSEGRCNSRFSGFFTSTFAALPPRSSASRLARAPRHALFGLSPAMAANTLGGCSDLVLTPCP